MYARQPTSSQLPRGGRLAPTHGTGLDLQHRSGNAALLDEMKRSPGVEGDVRASEFEDIGESDDEIVVGGPLPGITMPPDDDREFLYGRGAVDDGSVKVEAGLLKDPENGISLVGGQAQGGVLVGRRWGLEPGCRREFPRRGWVS